MAKVIGIVLGVFGLIFVGIYVAARRGADAAELPRTSAPRGPVAQAARAAVPRAAPPRAALTHKEIVHAIQDDLVAKFGADKLKGAVISAEPGEFSYTLALASSAPVIDGERASRAMVAQAIKMLMSAGHDPKKEWTMIFARVHQESEHRSPTGRATVWPLGKAWYDFNEDRVLFERPAR